LRAFKAVGGPDLGNQNSRRAWLRRIAHNLFIDHCRRNSRSPVSYSSEQAEAAEAYWKNDFLQHDEGFGCMEALEHCLQKLSEQQRELIDAFYAARRSREDIASALGITSDGVKMSLRRIRRSLGECIQQQLAQS
jgi:RNA polymerase sigma-70 factor (ECF subfamily)